MLAQDVDELQANGVAERLADVCHSDRLIVLDVGIRDRFAAALAGWAGCLAIDRDEEAIAHQVSLIEQIPGGEFKNEPPKILGGLRRHDVDRTPTALPKPADLQGLHSEATTGIEPV